MLCEVLAIGLAVDYSVHVTHAFVNARGSRQQRMEHALLLMGPPVVHGAISTFLAVLVLAGAKTYIFRAFFKMFFGICVFGLLHGVVFLPVLLALAGPPPPPEDAYAATAPAAKPATASAPPDALPTKGEPKALVTSTA